MNTLYNTCTEAHYPPTTCKKNYVNMRDVLSTEKIFVKVQYPFLDISSLLHMYLTSPRDHESCYFRSPVMLTYLMINPTAAYGCFIYLFYLPHWHAKDRSTGFRRREGSWRPPGNLSISQMPSSYGWHFAETA